MGPLSTFFVGAGFGAVGEVGFWLGTRAGTRPAPTGVFEGEDGEGGGRRQGQGRHLRGFGGVGGGWVGGVLSVGHLSNIGTRSVRDVVGEGALRGRSPRTREGRIGPTAQRRGESGEERGERKTCARLTRGRELTVAVPMGGVWGSGGRIGGGCGGGKCV